MEYRGSDFMTTEQLSDLDTRDSLGLQVFRSTFQERILCPPSPNSSAHSNKRMTDSFPRQSVSSLAPPTTARWLVWRAVLFSIKMHHLVVAILLLPVLILRIIRFRKKHA